MNDLLMSLLSFSIAVPFFFVLLKYKMVLKPYRPFFILITLSLIVEIISNVLYYRKISNAALLNVYVLIEFACWLFFFLYIRDRQKGNYYKFLVVAASVGLVVWLADNFFISKITEFNLWYKVYYSVILILLALDEINALIVYRKKSLKNNPVFIICAGLIIFFCYKIFIEVLWNFGPRFSRELLVNFFTVQSFVNAFVNLLFTLAVIWAPTKKYFLKPL